MTEKNTLSLERLQEASDTLTKLTDAMDAQGVAALAAFDWSKLIPPQTGVTPPGITSEAFANFCEKLVIDVDEDLSILLKQILAFDEDLDDCWDELKNLREKTQDFDEELGAIEEAIDEINNRGGYASRSISDLRREL